MDSIAFNKIAFNFKSSMNNYYVVDSIDSGKSKTRGLIIMWNYNVKLMINNAYNNYIDSYFEFPNMHNVCMLTTRYGFPSNPKNAFNLFIVV